MEAALHALGAVDRRERILQYVDGIMSSSDAHTKSAVLADLNASILERNDSKSQGSELVIVDRSLIVIQQFSGFVERKGTHTLIASLHQPVHTL